MFSEEQTERKEATLELFKEPGSIFKFGDVRLNEFGNGNEEAFNVLDEAFDIHDEEPSYVF
jgi:hypothetical protein